jgi:hypothetical protein
MTTNRKRMIKVGIVALVAMWAGWVSYESQHLDVPAEAPLGIGGFGGGPIAPGAPGFFGVANGSGLSGSGLTTNVERVNEGSGLTWCSGAVCVGQGSGITVDSSSIRTNLAGGTGAAGSAVVSLDAYGNVTWGSFVGSISAGSGISVSTSGAADTVAVHAGSGLTADGTNVRVNNGSGVTFNSGAVTINAGSGLTLDSTNLRTNISTGLAYSGGAIIVSITGGTCSNGQVVTAVSSSGVATCGNAEPNTYGNTHYASNEDFIAQGTTSSRSGPWAFAACQGTAVAPTMSASRTHPGVENISAGTVRPASMGFATAISSGAPFDPAYVTGLEMDAVVGFQTLDDGTDKYVAQYGLFNTCNSTPYNANTGCFFMYDHNNTATSGANGSNLDKWEIECVNNATRKIYLLDGSNEVAADGTFTTINSPISALSISTSSTDSNWQHLKIAMTSNTEADFYINGTKVGQFLNATDLPPSGTEIGQGMIMTSTAGANARTFSVDFMHLEYDLTARSP